MQSFPFALVLESVPFLTAMGFSPGPNNILVASSGVNFGFRATIPHIIGITIGYPAMLLLVGLGLMTIFVTSPEVHVVLKVVCIAYLLYLAWKIANAAAITVNARTVAKPMGFWQAAAFQWVNGKGWVVALSAVTTYTELKSPLLIQVLAIAGIALVVTIASVTSWALFGTALRRFLCTDARRRWFNYSMAALLVASIAPVIWE